MKIDLKRLHTDILIKLNKENINQTQLSKEISVSRGALDGLNINTDIKLSTYLKFVRWLENDLEDYIDGVSNSFGVGDASILIKGLEVISTWDYDKEEFYDDPGHCANMTLIKYYNSEK